MAPRIAIGERSGQLAVLAKIGHDKTGRNVAYDCRCDCGALVTMTSFTFRRRTRCIECSKISGAAKRTKHGGSRRGNVDPLYTAYKGMLTRCENPKVLNYKWYGAKGITVCAEWRNDFGTFRNWALAHGWQRGLTLDRIDEKRGYSPDNCAYITQSENSRRMREKYQLVPKKEEQFEPGITEWL